jgi:hypothetical protein
VGPFCQGQSPPDKTVCPPLLRDTDQSWSPGLRAERGRDCPAPSCVLLSLGKAADVTCYGRGQIHAICRRLTCPGKPATPHPGQDLKIHVAGKSGKERPSSVSTVPSISRQIRKSLSKHPWAVLCDTWGQNRAEQAGTEPDLGSASDRSDCCP